MPPLERSDLRGYAVLWPPTGVDEHGGRTYGGPTEVRCRWINKRREIRDPQNNTVVIDATVIVADVVREGSLMWEGRLAEWYGTGSNDTDEGIMEVVSYDDTPDIKYRNRRRELMLARYKDEVPRTS